MSTTVTIISDVHIGSQGSHREEFFNILRTLETDHLVLNGDIYDLALELPCMEFYNLVSNNPKIKKTTYIRGNHDANIDHYLSQIYPTFMIQNKVYLTPTIAVEHGHRFDYMIKSKNELSKVAIAWIKTRNVIEKTLKINIKKITNSLFGTLSEKLLLKTHTKANEYYHNKDVMVILGHTHIPLMGYLPVKQNCLGWPSINCGAMVDDVFSYITITLNTTRYKELTFHIKAKNFTSETPIKDVKYILVDALSWCMPFRFEPNTSIGDVCK